MLRGNFDGDEVALAAKPLSRFFILVPVERPKPQFLTQSLNLMNRKAINVNLINPSLKRQKPALNNLIFILWRSKCAHAIAFACGQKAQHILNHRSEISNPIVIKTANSQSETQFSARFMQKAFRFNLSVMKRHVHLRHRRKTVKKKTKGKKTKLWSCCT